MLREKRITVQMPDPKSLFDVQVAIGSVPGGVYFVLSDGAIVGQFSIPKSTGSSGVFAKGKMVRLKVPVTRIGKYTVADARGKDVSASMVLGVRDRPTQKPSR